MRFVIAGLLILSGLSSDFQLEERDVRINAFLLKSCGEGDLASAVRWLDRGAHVNAKDEDGSTPLIKAAATVTWK